MKPTLTLNPRLTHTPRQIVSIATILYEYRTRAKQENTILRIHISKYAEVVFNSFSYVWYLQVNFEFHSIQYDNNSLDTFLSGKDEWQLWRDMWKYYTSNNILQRDSLYLSLYSYSYGHRCAHGLRNNAFCAVIIYDIFPQFTAQKKEYT